MIWSVNNVFIHKSSTNISKPIDNRDIWMCVVLMCYAIESTYIFYITSNIKLWLSRHESKFPRASDSMVYRLMSGNSNFPHIYHVQSMSTSVITEACEGI